MVSIVLSKSNSIVLLLQFKVLHDYYRPLLLPYFFPLPMCSAINSWLLSSRYTHLVVLSLVLFYGQSNVTGCQAGSRLLHEQLR